MPEAPAPSTAARPSLRHALVRRIAEVAPGADLSIIGQQVRNGGRLNGLGTFLRERFQAITGAGLSPPPIGRGLARRGALPARDDAPGLSYLAAGDPAGQKVVFVHGTPGDASDWSGFLHAPGAGQHRLAIDRPGFGASGPGGPVVSLARQARAIAALLESLGGPAVVVGSSYGGPVALRLAADRPDLVSGLLLVGGAADPGHERIHALQHIVATRPLAAMMPRALAHSNAELLALPGELERLGADLARVRASVTVLHGLGDTLVPAGNAPYLAERLTGVARLRFVLVARAGHFLHLLSPGHVEDALTRLLKEIERPLSVCAPWTTA